MSSKGKKVKSRNLTRSHEDRINYIYHQIYSKKYPSAESLARDTGFSVDVIHNDIRYLREYKNLPLKVSRKAGREGYYYSKPVPEKLGSTFNEAGVMNFALAQQFMSTIPVKGKNTLDLDLKTLSEQLVPHTKFLLNAVSDTVLFRPFAPEEIDYELFTALSHAVSNRLELEFLYLKNLAPRPEWKKVRGFKFVVAAGCWYMVGLDVEKNEERTYLLSRISKPVVTERTFEDPKFDIDEYLKGAFIIMKGKESHDIVVEFSPWARTYIENRTFTRDQKVKKLPNGGLRMSFWLSCLDEVEMWVRFWGANCKVIGSEGLKDRMRKYRESLGYLG